MERRRSASERKDDRSDFPEGRYPVPPDQRRIYVDGLNAKWEGDVDAHAKLVDGLQ